ncbi:2TM domain-containing protein [Curvibacter sp. APW13]|uniref:2TM domain-containing protein n=1 Tax=Curvibacter sp. APW13 TaxID=3077236 RepID=UPI0028DE0F16|nr:2TM domain-containing protein [Curvibacter sp. APW13]MDT8992018.1 2TM domain-containing protein [Curvibacter sp. APW13]
MQPFPMPLSPDQEKLARRRAAAKMGWYTHATVFVLVNLLLLLKSSVSGHHWAIYPAFGWGIGLLVHGFVVFFGSAGGFGLRQSLLERERQRLLNDR